MIRPPEPTGFGRPYWWSEPVQNAAKTDLPDQCDILIVGAGYTGLSAAITAHDCGAHVIVVDKELSGFGASTRNGGMFGAHPRLGWKKLAKRFGADVADGVFAEADPALKFVKGLILKENIDCDLQETGRLQLAWTQSHFRAQQELYREVRQKGEVAIELVERNDLAGYIETDAYFGGILFSEHCAVNPAKFHAGLLAAVKRRGIVVGEMTEVAGVRNDRSGKIVRTRRGDIRARNVILATNGYTTPAFRWHQRRVFPLPSYIIATEPLPKDLIDRLIPGRQMMVETRARHSYFRVSPDGTRILFGGRAAMVGIDLDKAAQRLYDTMTGIWPALKGKTISHAWTGNTGFSFAQMPCVGCAQGIHFAMGYSGSGTVMAPYLGAKIAYQVVGDQRGKTAYCATTLQPNILHPFRKPYFLKVADIWHRNFVDKKDDRAGRLPQ